MSGLIYLIYAQSYDENQGGVIFQHQLVHQLRGLGEEAYLWPQKPLFRKRLRKRVRDALFPPKLTLNPDLDTPVASQDLLRDPRAVVIYPEIIPGNPLGARNVVRWLLYEPGALLGEVEFGENEMFFVVSPMCDIKELTGGAPELYVWSVNPTYRNEDRPNRDGTCYIVRKGFDKPRIAETETPDAIRIDGLSHDEINDILNRCSVFYSYDEATMYSQFAALTGCLSVVIPGMYQSRAEWVAAHELARYGVAYGLEPDELDHARTTQDNLAEMLRDKERASTDTVRNFVTLTRERFL